MFLSNMLANNSNLSKINNLDNRSCTYPVMYRYWCDALFERVMRLFVWSNTNEVNPKEIEQRLILAGHCGITKINKEEELTAMYGSFNGVTKYQDEFKNYMVHCPIYSGQREIGKDIIVINNNALRNPTFELVHHYAVLLAHNEVTLINLLINARDSGGTPIAQTQKQKDSIKDYQAKIFNGKYDVVMDIGGLGIEYAGTDKRTHQDIVNVMEVRDRLIKDFNSDIGVRSSFEKRNNAVEAEITSDTSLLLLNLSDMLKQRKDACIEINKLFNVNWVVEISEEIDYSSENQPKPIEEKEAGGVINGSN